jgi:Protein of unknown function (DUF3035)
MNKIISSVIVFAASLTLSACESTREQFDFSKKAPDEFAVVKRAPLEMPPSFEVRAPRPGAPRPQEQATDQMAREAILGPDAQKALAKEAGVTQGEAVLLQKTGAANASPAIRAKVDAETAELIKEETPGINALKEMVGQKATEPSFEEVDPIAETNRIKQNKAQGKPIGTGKTPIKDEDEE